MCDVLHIKIILFSQLFFFLLTNWYQSPLLEGPLTEKKKIILQILLSSSMNSSKTPFTVLAPLIFNGEGYLVWAARMEAHLEVSDL